MTYFYNIFNDVKLTLINKTAVSDKKVSLLWKYLSEFLETAIHRCSIR